jgi:hypothetical protein
MIKTSGGKVITKNGKPSCSCCGGGCVPDVSIVYAQVVFDPEGSPVVIEYMLTGGLNEGRFVFGENNPILAWRENLTPNQWTFGELLFSGQDTAFGVDGPATNRCDPQGVYQSADEYMVTISFLPFS